MDIDINPRAEVIDGEGDLSASKDNKPVDDGVIKIIVPKGQKCVVVQDENQIKNSNTHPQTVSNSASPQQDNPSTGNPNQVAQKTPSSGSGMKKLGGPMRPGGGNMGAPKKLGMPSKGGSLKPKQKGEEVAMQPNQYQNQGLEQDQSQGQGQASSAANNWKTVASGAAKAGKGTFKFLSKGYNLLYVLIVFFIITLNPLCVVSTALYLSCKKIGEKTNEASGLATFAVGMGSKALPINPVLIGPILLAFTLIVGFVWTRFCTPALYGLLF